MTGYPEFNFPAFDRAAALGRSIGWEVVSPAEQDRVENGFDPTGLSGDPKELDGKWDIMKAAAWDIKMVMECAAIAMLPGWEKSKGATAEHGVAKWLGKKILDATTFLPLDEAPTALGEASAMRNFGTGATRNNDATLPDYEGFVSPLALRAFGEYMHKHRFQADGTVRASDNWQKGIPLESYIKSGFRHFMDWWLFHRGQTGRETLVDALCALMFNVQGYLHEILKKEQES